MKVALMLTCINDALFPETGKAVVRLLRRLGVDVDFPPARPAAASRWSTRLSRRGRSRCAAWVSAFEGYDAIVVPSGSCAGCGAPPARARRPAVGDPALSEPVTETGPQAYELTEFLVDVLGVEDVGAYFPHRVTYHPTCHSLRMLGVGDRPARLLSHVRGIRLVELPAAEECCGFGGTFAVKNAETSVSMGSDKVRHARDTGAEVLVASDNSCLMHLGGLLSREQAGMRVMHLPRCSPPPRPRRRRA